MFRSLLLPIIAGVSLVFATYHVISAQKPLPKTSPPREPARSPFERAIAGVGLVEARTENIAIGSQISGVVVEVSVKVGQRVRSGEPLFVLDTRQVRSDLAVRQALLTSAKAQLQRLADMPRPEQLPPQQARLQEARANLAEAEDAHRRAQQLSSRRVIADEELVRARQRHEAARAQVDRVQAEDTLLRAGAWQADKAVAQAAVAHAQAQVDQIQTELDRHRVVAPKPSSGPQAEFEVLQVNVRPGEYIGAPSSQALIVLGDAGPRHVRVDIDEHDIPRFRREQPAVAKVRGGDDGRTISLRFDRVEPYVRPKRSLTGDATERVDTRVLQAIYAIEKDDRTVFVGQQLDVFIQL
jgi:HlyD family secretion protein